jgi:hypothetical protein
MSLPPDDDGTVISFNRATPAPTPAHNAGSNHALPNGACRAEFEITGLLGEGGFGIVYLASAGFRHPAGAPALSFDVEWRVGRRRSACAGYSGLPPSNHGDCHQKVVEIRG